MEIANRKIASKNSHTKQKSIHKIFLRAIFAIWNFIKTIWFTLLFSDLDYYFRDIFPCDGPEGEHIIRIVGIGYSLILFDGKIDGRDAGFLRLFWRRVPRKFSEKKQENSKTAKNKAYDFYFL
jgi:hypothetical protein